MKLEKMLFISIHKLFLFSRKSNFRILDIQVSWCHQMPQHKTRNTFYWITCEVNTSVNEICPVYAHIRKEKILWKNSAKASSRSFRVCKKLTTTSVGKWNLWSNLLILSMYYPNYQNLAKSAYRPPQIPFYRGEK